MEYLKRDNLPKILQLGKKVQKGQPTSVSLKSNTTLLDLFFGVIIDQG